MELCSRGRDLPWRLRVTGGPCCPHQATLTVSFTLCGITPPSLPLLCHVTLHSRGLACAPLWFGHVTDWTHNTCILSGSNRAPKGIKMVLGGGGEKLSYYNVLHEGLYEET